MSESRPESLWEQVNRLLGRYLAASSGLPPDLLALGDLSRAWRSLPDGRDPLGAEERPPEAEAQDPASASENGAGEVPVRSGSVEAPAGQIPSDGTAPDGNETQPSEPGEPVKAAKPEAVGGPDGSGARPSETGEPVKAANNGPERGEARLPEAGEVRNGPEAGGPGQREGLWPKPGRTDLLDFWEPDRPDETSRDGAVPEEPLCRRGEGASAPAPQEQAGDFQTEDEMYGDQLPARRSASRTEDAPFPQEQAGDFQTEDEMYGDRLPARLSAPQTEDGSFPQEQAGGFQTEDELFGDQLPARRSASRTEDGSSGLSTQEQAGDFQTEDEMFGDRIPQKRRILAPQTEDEQYGDRLPPRRRAAPAPQTEDEVYGDRLPPRRPSGRTG